MVFVWRGVVDLRRGLILGISMFLGALLARKPNMQNLCALFVLVVFSAGIAPALDCPREVASEPSELVQFLKTQASIAAPGCVTQAITRLSNFRTPLGSAVLIDLLDFRRPESLKEKYHLGDTNDKYPAVPALFSVGLPAIPPLLIRLQSGKLSEVARANAIRVVVFIHRENPPEAVRNFKEAAGKAHTQEEASRLRSCARDAVAFCSEGWRARCSEEVK